MGLKTFLVISGVPSLRGPMGVNAICCQLLGQARSLLCMAVVVVMPLVALVLGMPRLSLTFHILA